MHPRDVHRLNELLGKLRDKGNTVHRRGARPGRDQGGGSRGRVGPGAGKQGGEVVFQGSYAGLVKSDTLTGRHLRARTPVKTVFRAPSGKLAIRGARVNNLKDMSVDIPGESSRSSTGGAGSGKSSLINEVFLAQHPEAVVIDQAAAGDSTRSNPATYTGVMDDIRKAFAAANKVDAGLFSFNSKGACEPTATASGVIYTDLGTWPSQVPVRGVPGPPLQG